MKLFMIMLAVGSILFIAYICQPKSRRMFISNLAKQIIYLIPRYFV